MRTKRKALPILLLLALFGWLLAFPSMATASGPPTGQVCGGLTSGKIDTTGDPMSVTITADAGYLIVEVCTKGGSAQQGDGPVYIDLSPGVTEYVVTYTDRDGKAKAVSHYSYRQVPIPTETTTTTPPVTTTTATTPPVTTTVPPTTTTTTTTPPSTTTQPPTTTTTTTPVTTTTTPPVTTTSPPVTTSPPTTSTTTSPATTTTTAPPVTTSTTTAPPVTTSAAPPSTDPPVGTPGDPPSPPVATARLAYTGFDPVGLVTWAVGLLALGAGLIRVALDGRTVKVTRRVEG